MRTWLCLAVVALGGAVQAAERPNFVFLYTDDQRWDALGVVQREQGEQGRFPWLESPNLDRLAADGVRFRNAFVVESLCAPSRAAFLTGRYGHLNGVVNNGTPFPEQSVTHATVLRAAGYRTGYFGKWHMGSQSGQRPGFDFSASFVGQGNYFDCPIEVNGVKTSSTGFVDDVTTDYAVNFIKDNKDRPFSIVLGFKTCHGPFTPPPRTADEYEGAEARAVPNLAVPAVYKEVETRDFTKKNGGATNLGMFRGLKAVDENVGKILATLDELGLAENTMVIYSSDNGYYLGEHGLGDKRTAYDEALRIPLLVRFPKLANQGAKGKVVDRMVLNIDLAPTLIDYAGLQVPQEMQGRSWRPLLEADPQSADWRSSYFYFYPKEGKFGAPTVLAVRTDAAKLVRYPGRPEWTEMFDLKADPYEIDNLYGKPDHAVMQQRLEAEFEKQRAAAEFNLSEEALIEGGRKAAVAVAKPIDADVLLYEFAKDEGDRVVDSSGKRNRGRADGAPLVDGRDGRKARQFDGRGVLDVDKSPLLDPSAGPLTVEATVLAEGPDGMIVANGGRSNGYGVFVRDGKPGFTYNADNKTTTLIADESIVGRWTTVTAQVSAERQVRLLVDGKPAAKQKLPAFIDREPNDSLQIGADQRSPVVEKLPGFQGLIERVRIYSGDETAAAKK